MRAARTVKNNVSDAAGAMSSSERTVLSSAVSAYWPYRTPQTQNTQRTVPIFSMIYSISVGTTAQIFNNVLKVRSLKILSTHFEDILCTCAVLPTEIEYIILNTVH